MPSPLAHMATGYVVFEVARSHMPKADSSLLRRGILLMGALGFSLLPDMDSLAGVLAKDFGRYHNNLTHSFAMGLYASLVIAAGSYILDRKRVGTWTLLGLACYELHVLMDFFTVGRGVMIFWPISPERWEPAMKLFYGLHWSDGWFSHKHLWTLLNELVFAFILLSGAKWLRKRRQAA